MRRLGEPLQPGSTIGILGGGQLGRMLPLAASRLGLNTHIFSPDAEGPAAQVATLHTQGDYEDLDAVLAFSNSCDVITYEFENIPAMSARLAATKRPLNPGILALETAQDRLNEKTFIRDTAKVAVGAFENIESLFDLKRAIKIVGLPCVLKTRRFGYDGKGQYILRDESDCENAWDAIGEQPAILEQFIPFKREVSVIAARSSTGETAAYPLIENVHRNHILQSSVAPAFGDDGRAQGLAIQIMSALDYVGVMATEFFELEDGTYLVNEIAPRVHNSGHWTQDAGCIDQFELHIRAISAWPLGSTKPVHGMRMINLIGEEADQWRDYADRPLSFVHLYGKREKRPGRKMGHVNQIVT